MNINMRSCFKMVVRIRSIVAFLVIEHICIVVFILKTRRSGLYNEAKIESIDENVTNIAQQNDVSSIEEIEQENNGILHGCHSTLQTLLFCHALNEANISFTEREVQVNSERVMVTFRKRTFPIIMPLRIVRACYNMKHGQFFQCNALSSNMETLPLHSNPEEKYYLQIIYLVLMSILPQMGTQYHPGYYFPYFCFEESYASDDPEQLKLWQEENLDKLIDHHTLSVSDVMKLKETSITSFGDLLTNHNTRPVHIFAHVNKEFPSGNVGDTLGPYITGLFRLLRHE